jgi:hypothetical protein
MMAPLDVMVVPPHAVRHPDHRRWGDWCDVGLQRRRHRLRAIIIWRPERLVLARRDQQHRRDRQ